MIFLMLIRHPSAQFPRFRSELFFSHVFKSFLLGCFSVTRVLIGKLSEGAVR